MEAQNVTFINRNELFTPEQRRKIEEVLKLFEGFSRRTLEEDPERLHKIRNILCEAEKE